jgi:hypothetical protein
MAEQQWFKPGIPLRPQRLELRAPVRYRAAGAAQWQVGRSENISLTGALIRGARLMAVSAKIELILKVPPGLVPDISGEMLFAGSVARVVAGRIPGESPGMGIQFESWRPVTDADAT